MLGKLSRPVLVGLWIGLLLLPLNVRVEKKDLNVVRFEPHLERSLYIAAAVAALGLLSLAARRVRTLPAVSSALAAAGRASATAAAGLTATPGRRLVVALIPLLLAALLPVLGSDYFVSVGTQTAIYVCLALGLNIVVGQAGLLVLGYAAFFAAGAYTYGILNHHFHVSFWLGLPAGAIVATLFGLLLGAPTLRLRGDYLAIVTLGFGEMMRIVLVTADRLTNGPNGILGIDRPRLLSWEASDGQLYWLTLGLVVLAVLVNRRLDDSRMGRAWVAMREDETAARTMGIDITRMRLLAFSLSALWAGLCGVFFAAKQTFISPESFTFNESVNILAMVILGGMGSIPGVIAGAVLLGLLPELLRGFADYRLIILAGLMVTMMLFRPQGLFPSVRRRMELADEAARP